MVFIGKALIIDDVVPGRYAVSSDGKVFDFKYNRMVNGHLNRGYLGIHQRTIEGITNGYNWVDISSKYMFPQKAGRVMLSKDKVREVCFMFAKDYTIKEVSDILEIPYPTVSSIRQKVSHKEISDNYF